MEPPLLALISRLAVSRSLLREIIKSGAQVPLFYWKFVFLQTENHQMQSKLVTRILGTMAVLAVQTCSIGLAFAQGPSVIIQAEGQAITAADLEAELAKAPKEARLGLLERPDGLAQLASNLLLRRVLAKQAEVAGADKTPQAEAALRLVRDRVLSEIQLQRIDEKNRIPDDVLEKRIQDVYRAESKRFEVPEEVRASHILIAKGEGAKEKAEKLLKELRDGGDFAALAKENSIDPGSSARGGDLGYFGRNRMAKPFEDAAFGMKEKGQLSDVVESQFGYHIIRFEDRKPGGVKPLAEVRDEIKTVVTNKFLSEARVAEGEKIMAKAKANPDQLEQFIATQKNK